MSFFSISNVTIFSIVKPTLIEIIFKNINIATPSDFDGVIQLNIIVMFLGIFVFNTYSRKFRRKLNNILVVLVASVLVAFVLVAFVVVAFVAFVFVAFVLLGLVDSVTKKK